MVHPVSPCGGENMTKVNWSALGQTKTSNTLEGAAEKVPTYPLLKTKTFFQANPEPSYTMVVPVLEDKATRKIYIPNIELEPELQKDLKPKTLVLCQSIDGQTFVLPIRAAREGEALDSWSETAYAAVELAKSEWVRFQPNTVNGFYDLYRAKNVELAPIWPDISMDAILDITFKGYIIDSDDHPLLKKLRGVL